MRVLWRFACANAAVTALTVSMAGCWDTARYMTDAVRRVLTESVLPLVLQWISGWCAKRKGNKTASWSAKELQQRDEYEPFDDYLELVIEFGCACSTAVCR